LFPLNKSFSSFLHIKTCGGWYCIHACVRVIQACPWAGRWRSWFRICSMSKIPKFTQKVSSSNLGRLIFLFPSCAVLVLQFLVVFTPVHLCSRQLRLQPQLRRGSTHSGLARPFTYDTTRPSVRKTLSSIHFWSRSIEFGVRALIFVNVICSSLLQLRI
jgi:hypothetical protein